jgi:hypothetical protein
MVARNPENQKPTADSQQPVQDSTESLRQRIEQLEFELATEKAAKEIAEEESARLAAQGQSAIFTSGVTERPAGKADDGKTDLWWYRIDLAPSGGTEIKINGTPYYHGQTYKFDTDLLRSIKEIVARTWDHENNIMGANENMYRREQNRILRGGERRA